MSAQADDSAGGQASSELTSGSAIESVIEIASISPCGVTCGAEPQGRATGFVMGGFALLVLFFSLWQWRRKISKKD